MSRTSCSKIALPKHFMLASFDVRRKCRADAAVCRSEPDIDPPALPTVGCLADLPFNKNWPCAFAPSQFYSKPSRTVHAAQDHPTKATRLTALGCGRAVGIATSRRQNEHNDRPYCVCACCLELIARVVEKVLVKRFEIVFKAQDLKTIAITHRPDL